MFLWDPFRGRVSGTTLQNRMKWYFFLILGKQTHLIDVFCIPCNFHVQYLWGDTQEPQVIFMCDHRSWRAVAIPGVFCTAFQVPVAGLSGSAIGLRLDGLAKRRACPVCFYNMEWLFLKSNNYIAAHQWVTSDGEKKDSYVSENGHPLWTCSLNPSLPLLTPL